MPSLKTYRLRIRSVQSTQKITKETDDKLKAFLADFVKKFA
jgi:hypothetical protein